MRFIKQFWAVVCLGIVALNFGCETQKINPVGSHLVGRDPGQVVELAPIAMTSGESFLDLIYPLALGERQELLVGQMNGFAYRSLLKFQVPVDSLARAAGGTAADLVVESVRIELGLEFDRHKNHAQLAVHEPRAEWSELQLFVDTLRFVELEMPSVPLAGGQVALSDTGVVVSLPVSHFEAARAQNAQTPQVEILLEPEGTGEFLLGMISRQAVATHTFERRPRFVLHYRVGDTPGVFHVRPTADTYWGARVNGGPSRDQLLLSRGTFYATLLKFDLPAIPQGATVNAARLVVDVDHDRSFFTSLPFAIYHVHVNASDTTYTQYSTQVNLELGSVELPFNQALVQAWITGAQINHGMALRPLFPSDHLSWAVLRDVQLKLVYSLPPEIK